MRGLGRNRLTMIAEPLERGVAEDIENGRVTMRMPVRERGKFSRSGTSGICWRHGRYGRLARTRAGRSAARHTLPSQVSPLLTRGGGRLTACAGGQGAPGSVKEHIRQGFQWGAREGPLCDERAWCVRACDAAADGARDSAAECQVRVLGLRASRRANIRGGGQIVPTARRVC